MIKSGEDGSVLAIFKYFKEAFTMAKDVRTTAEEIVDVFDDFLAEKEIKIQCADLDEEAERYAGGENVAALYGTEYWSIVDRVENILSAAAVE